MDNFWVGEFIHTEPRVVHQPCTCENGVVHSLKCLFVECRARAAQRGNVSNIAKLQRRNYTGVEKSVDSGSRVIEVVIGIIGAENDTSHRTSRVIRWDVPVWRAGR